MRTIDAHLYPADHATGGCAHDPTSTVHRSSHMFMRFNVRLRTPVATVSDTVRAVLTGTCCSPACCHCTGAPHTATSQCSARPTLPEHVPAAHAQRPDGIKGCRTWMAMIWMQL